MEASHRREAVVIAIASTAPLRHPRAREVIRSRRRRRMMNRRRLLPVVRAIVERWRWFRIIARTIRNRRERALERDWRG